MAEAPKQQMRLVFRDADAGIFDRDDHHIAVSALYVNDQPAVLGELDGIGQQIEENLTCPQGVDEQPVGRVGCDA